MLKKLAKAFAPSRKITDPLEEPFILEKDDSSSEAGTEFNNSGNIFLSHSNTFRRKKLWKYEKNN